MSKRHLRGRRGALRSSLQDRTPATEEQLLRLALEAAEARLVDPAEIGVLVTATYYSLGGPTLAHRLLDHSASGRTRQVPPRGRGLRERGPLFRLAGAALRDRPGAGALVVAAEA